MKSTVTEISEDVFRISTFNPDYRIQFNQFLIRDDEPFIMHTGLKRMFPFTLDAVASVIHPSRIRWIGFSHFESDECGALNSWLQVAPQAQALCSFVGAMVSVTDFADRPPRPMQDNEVLATGRHRLRFLASPHIPHGWDAGLFFEETGKTFLCSDLFFQPGNPEPLIGSDIIERARDAIVKGLHSPLAKDMPYAPWTDSTLKRFAALNPETLAAMHGSSFRGNCQDAILKLADAFRETLGNLNQP